MYSLYTATLLILVLPSCLCKAVLDQTTSQPTVDTKLGRVSGIRVTTPDGQIVDRYLGIPFAKPPIKELRFKKPIANDPWTGVFNATNQAKTCHQKLIPLVKHLPVLEYLRPYAPMDEDCLQLNLWVPANNTEKLPVMVWIYGGGFSRGAINFSPYDGQILSGAENVIVVTINYRVASLGFLFMDHPDAPGNVGLWDQHLGLEWVRDNIASFGGDPQEVTLFGQSAGASSVVYHQLSPSSRSLFKRVIVESGAPNAHFGFVDPKQAKIDAIDVAKALGCSGDVTAILTCLREADPADLISSEPQGDYDDNHTFRPTIDNGAFLPADPLTMMKEGNMKAVDMLAGSVRNEASPFMIGIAPFLFSFTETLRVTKEDAFGIGKNLLKYGDTFDRLVQILYSDSHRKQTWKEIAEVSIDAVSDYAFTCPLNQVAYYNNKAGGKVFKYLFTHRSSNSLFPSWAGTVHMEDTFYVFGLPLDPKRNYNAEEVELSRRIMRSFANFARTGDPNKSTNDTTESIQWPSYNENDQMYLVLAPNSTATGSFLRDKYCQVWADIMPDLRSAESERVARRGKLC